MPGPILFDRCSAIEGTLMDAPVKVAG